MSRRHGAIFLSALLAAAALIAAPGCGSESSSSKHVGSSPEGIAVFRVPGGPKKEVNEIIDGSREASVEVREAASRVLKASFEAKARSDWAAQCLTLTKAVIEVAEENGSPFLGARTPCAKSLERAGEGADPRALANNLSGPITALRMVGGFRAFAFYRGPGGERYMIPMEEERGAWKVNSLTAQEIPGS